MDPPSNQNTRKRSLYKNFQKSTTRTKRNEWKKSISSVSYVKMFSKKKEILQRALKKFRNMEDTSSHGYTVYLFVFMSLGEAVSEEFKKQVYEMHRDNAFQKVLVQTIKYRKLSKFTSDDDEEIGNYIEKIIEFMEFMLWLIENEDMYPGTYVYANLYIKRFSDIIDLTYTKAKKYFSIEKSNSNVNSLINIFKTVKL